MILQPMPLQNQSEERRSENSNTLSDSIESEIPREEDEWYDQQHQHFKFSKENGKKWKEKFPKHETCLLQYITQER